MSKIAIKGATTGTGVFTLESPATNTDRTLILPDEAGTVLTSASDVAQKGVPAFSAYNSSTSRQTVSTTTYTKVVLPTKEFDTHGFFDNTTDYRFQPTIAGYYLVNATVYSQATGGLTRTIGAFAKNGNIYWRFNDTTYASTTFERAPSGSKVIYMNGSTDYIELFVYLAGSGTIYASSTSTTSSSRLEAILVRAD